MLKQRQTEQLPDNFISIGDAADDVLKTAKRNQKSKIVSRILIGSLLVASSAWFGFVAHHYGLFN